MLRRERVARREPPCGEIRGMPRKTRIAPQGGFIRATAFSKKRGVRPSTRLGKAVRNISYYDIDCRPRRKNQSNYGNRPLQDVV